MDGYLKSQLLVKYNCKLDILKEAEEVHIRHYKLFMFNQGKSDM